MTHRLLAFLAAITLTAPQSFATEAQLLSAFSGLENHLLGTPTLSGAQIAAHKATIDSNEALFGTKSAVMTAAHDLVDTYDTQIGPLWLAGSPVQSFDRNSVTDEDINWVVYTVMQDLIDETYTDSNLVTHATLLDGRTFGSSAHFPGSVAPPFPVVTHTATINASYPDTAGWLRQQDDLPARKPTGAYAAPGSIVTVTVPSAMVNKGYQIRVGAHSWDLETRKTTVKRLDRSTILYDINSTEIKVGNPLGGGIYIEVPYLANEGVEDIDITGAVRSPFFSSNTVTDHITTLSEWQTTERNHPAPWADFQTEKIMTQVPKDWIYNLDDPVTLMADWDKAIDTMNDLMGFPRDRGKETMYLQVDVILRGNAYFPGWPTSNITYNPNTNYNGLANNHLTKGPLFADSYVLHEQGHAYFFKKFAGETESHVNLPHVAIWNQAFGIDLDTAFAASRSLDGNPNRTLNNTAITWMTSFNFSPRDLPMTQVEKQYQIKGHAKFVDIARLFGWQAMNDYHAQLVADNVRNNTGSESDDDLIVRLAIATGVDIRPLLHFWGIHPDNPTAVANAIVAEGLTESNEIYDLLWFYRSLIPEDNAAFQTFASDWWGAQPDIGGFTTESEHARQWDATDLSGGSPLLPNGEIYDTSSHARITARVDALLSQYFPGGDPMPDLTAPTLQSIADNVSGGPVYDNQTVTYTVTFSEMLDESTVEASDFGNAGSPAAAINSVIQTGDPAVFEVSVSPGGPGTLRLQIMGGADLRDLANNPLDTAAAIPDDTTYTVEAHPNLAGELGVLEVNTNGGINPATGEAWLPGDTYRLAFLTSTTGEAVATDIADYNAFVQGVAASSTAYPDLGDGTWRVLGSTESVNARVNTGTNDTSAGIGDPIFVLDGTTLIATDNADLWDGFGLRFAPGDSYSDQDMYYSPYLDENGVEPVTTGFGSDVWTGSGRDGTQIGNQFLGHEPNVAGGNSGSNNNTRIFNRWNTTNTNLRRFYALSDPLTVVIVLTDYDHWSTLYPGADLSDPQADFDGDGLTNNEERIWGLDPTTGSSLQAIDVPLDPAVGSFSYTRRATALTGLTYEVWTSTDLNIWNKDAGASQALDPVGPNPDPNGVETVIVTPSAGLLSANELFVRVSASE